MKLRALVIDDSKVMRSMVMQTLNRTGLAEFEFIEAEDGVDAVNKFNVKNTDIVFADWNMPNMTGIDFVRKVRSMGKTEHIPIIMVTSEKTMDKVETALDKAGANAYICKPFTVDDMQRKIGKIIQEVSEHKEKAASGGGFFSKLVGGG